jgi:hypothetical protein
MKSKHRLAMARNAVEQHDDVVLFDWLAGGERNRGQARANTQLAEQLRRLLIDRARLFARIDVLPLCGDDALPRLRSAFLTGVVCISNRAALSDNDNDDAPRALLAAAQRRHGGARLPVYIFDDLDAQPMSSTVFIQCCLF